MTKPAILITGSSSGIGLALAKELVAGGHTVVATARNLDSIQELSGLGCITIQLDVTSRDSIDHAMTAIIRQNLHVATLVNNAGYGYYGPLEECSYDTLRSQFETNVFGLMEVTKRVLPSMRQQNHGRIINISSVVGLVSFPFIGVYSASKFALEALGDALRGEVKNWNIDVVHINPGPVSTNFATVSRGQGMAVLKPNSPYEKAYAAVLGHSNPNAAGQDKKKSKMSSETAAKIIARVCTAPKVRYRYKLTRFGKLMPLLKKVLPQRWFEYLLWKGMHI